MCVCHFGDKRIIVFGEMCFLRAGTKIIVMKGDKHHLTIFCSSRFGSFSAVILVEARLLLVTGFPALSANNTGLSGVVSANCAQCLGEQVAEKLEYTRRN